MMTLCNVIVHDCIYTEEKVNFSPGQVQLSGSSMWFHLDHQGLQLHSADRLSDHRVGAVQKKKRLQ